ncbi:MAG: hypothetical protein D6B27_00200 [Gammaproteobacteria bacterium]|nr:MAG: hypothetical protein D6B27_00200 [Gammaproteobacteria bacterium]
MIYKLYRVNGLVDVDKAYYMFEQKLPFGWRVDRSESEDADLIVETLFFKRISVSVERDRDSMTTLISYNAASSSLIFKIIFGWLWFFGISTEKFIVSVFSNTDHSEVELTTFNSKPSVFNLCLLILSIMMFAFDFFAFYGHWRAIHIFADENMSQMQFKLYLVTILGLGNHLLFMAGTIELYLLRKSAIVFFVLELLLFIVTLIIGHHLIDETLSEVIKRISSPFFLPIIALVYSLLMNSTNELR